MRKKEKTLHQKKRAKIHSSKTFNAFKYYDYNFNGQSSKRYIFNNKKDVRNYKLLDGFGKYSNYNIQQVYPGQKVWIIRMHDLTGQLSVDYDYVLDVFSFGSIGEGKTINYWLYNYGKGYALEYMIDFFPTKKIAEYYMKKVTCII
jgi:hypothetical protein